MYQVKYSQLSLPDLHDCVFSHQLRFVYIIIIISADHGNGVSSFVQIIHSYFLILLYLDIFLFIKFFPPQVQHGNSSRCFEVLFFSVYYYHSVITSVVLVLTRLLLFFLSNARWFSVVPCYLDSFATFLVLLKFNRLLCQYFLLELTMSEG